MSRFPGLLIYFLNYDDSVIEFALFLETTKFVFYKSELLSYVPQKSLSSSDELLKLFFIDIFFTDRRTLENLSPECRMSRIHCHGCLHLYVLVLPVEINFRLISGKSRLTYHHSLTNILQFYNSFLAERIDQEVFGNQILVGWS